LSIQSGWEELAREMDLANKMGSVSLSIMKSMFYAGAMYVATHQERIDAMLVEGIRDLKLFDSNTGDK
jgi:hypothetical protein